MLMLRFPCAIAVFCITVLAGALCLDAATPDLQVILPRGVQRGTEADLELHGNRLNDAQDILFFTPGITVKSWKVVNPQRVDCHVQVAKDAPVGEICTRLRSASGLSDVRTVYVGPFPILPEAKTNIDFEHPQPVTLNTTITGVIQNEQAQYFSVDLKKGQPLTVEVHGMRLGDDFDPYVAILNKKKYELAVSDDTALTMQDPIASIVAPDDGTYFIQLRDSSYRGGSQAHYLMHVGLYPRPRALYPMGGQVGEQLTVHCIDDAAGPFDQTIKLPDKPESILDLIADHNGLLAPSPNFLRVSPFPNVLESEPNNDPQHATVANGELPLALNGIIEKPNDVDFFRFKAHRGQPIDIRVYARALRSPLDSVIVLYNEKGNYIASNDDSGSPDSYLRFDPPADGQYLVSIYDQLHAGGPDYTYRIELTPVKPRIVLSIPQYNINTQERWTIPVPRGNRYATLIRATRSDFGGDVKLECPDLPPGMTMIAPDVSEITDVTPVVFEAKPDAPIGGKLCDLFAKPTNPKIDAPSEYRQQIDLVIGINNQPMYKTYVHQIAVAATEEAPFTLHLEQPKVPLVQGGLMNLKVTATRKAGFKNPISLRLLFQPPGTGAPGAVDLPGDKDEMLYPLNANTNAPLKKWKICVLGESDVSGQLWVSSELVEIEVAKPYVTGQIQMAAAEQGKPAQLLCKLDQQEKFDGKAKVQLLGLPAGVIAEDKDITDADKEVIIPLKIDPKSPVGKHNSLFCRVTVMKDGQEIIHNLSHGVLRIDPPDVPKGKAQAVAKAPKPGVTARPLTRLEKLRQEEGSVH